MELFANIVIDRKPITILGKSSILDLWLGSEYSSEISKVKCNSKVKVTLYAKMQEKGKYLRKSEKQIQQEGRDALHRHVKLDLAK